MKKMWLITCFLLVISVAGYSRGEEQQMVTDMTYLEGQVWTYKTRPEEENSRLYIVKIDTDTKLGKIYHLYIDAVELKNPHIPGGVQNHLPHLPVSQETLDTSVTRIVKDQATPKLEIPDGYNIWRSAFDEGKAGMFTIPVSQIIQYIEDSFKENN